MAFVALFTMLPAQQLSTYRLSDDDRRVLTQHLEEEAPAPVAPAPIAVMPTNTDVPPAYRIARTPPAAVVPEVTEPAPIGHYRMRDGTVTRAIAKQERDR